MWHATCAQKEKKEQVSISGWINEKNGRVVASEKTTGTGGGGRRPFPPFE